MGMKIFRVYTHPEKEPELVKYGWAWPAFFFGALWTLLNGLFMYTLLLVALLFIPSLGNVWAGLEGNNWRAKRLLRLGYTHVADVEAISFKEANRMVPKVMSRLEDESSDQSATEPINDG